MGLCQIVSTLQQRVWKLHAPALFAAPEANVTVYPYLTGINVTVEQEAITSFQVTFDAPYEEGIKMLYEDSNGLSAFNASNVIMVCMGYPSDNLWTPWYYGILNKGGEGIEITSEGVKGTISAQQCPWQDYYVMLGNRTWKTSMEEMVRELVSFLQGNVVISEQARKRMTTYDANRNGEEYSTFNKGAIEALQDMARQADIQLTQHSSTHEGEPTTYELTAPYEETTFGRQEEQVRHKYIMRGGFKPQENEYPILSWGPEAGIASWLGSRPESTNAGLFAAAINPKTGKMVSSTVTPEMLGTPSYGNYPEKGKPQTKQLESGKVLDTTTDGTTAVPAFMSAPGRSNADDGAVQNDLKAKATARMTQGNLTQISTITTLGVPTQGLWKKISVLGCSPRYDGPYMVQGVTHRWGPGLFESELKVIRWGTFETDEQDKAQLVQDSQLKKD
jgi:hypothetical protein